MPWKADTDVEAPSWSFQSICTVLVERRCFPYSSDSTVSGNFAFEDLLPLVMHWQLLFCPSMYTWTSLFSHGALSDFDVAFLSWGHNNCHAKGSSRFGSSCYTVFRPSAPHAFVIVLKELHSNFIERGMFLPDCFSNLQNILQWIYFWQGLRIV